MTNPTPTAGTRKRLSLLVTTGVPARHGGGWVNQAYSRWWWYHSLTAQQHQKGHTVPKQVAIATSIQVFTVQALHCVSIRYQAKSEQNVRQDLIRRVRHGEAALCTPTRAYTTESNLQSVI